MVHQRLLRLTSTNNTSNFETLFNPPLILPKDSSVALQSLNLELVPDTVEIIRDYNDQISFAPFSITNPPGNLYTQSMAAHNCIIPPGKYNIEDLVYNTLNPLLNSKLRYISNQLYTKEQGAEIVLTIDQNKVFEFRFFGRDINNFIGPAANEVTLDNGMDYAVNANLGTLTRTFLTSVSFDKFLFTNNLFCRGSGQIAFEQNAPYDFMCGLIEPRFINSATAPNDIYDNITYGFLSSGGSNFYIKTSQSTPWTNSGIAPNGGNAKYLTLANGKIDFRGDIEGQISECPYVYGNYVMVLSIKENGVSINNIQWTECLPTKTLNGDGYYNLISPEAKNEPEINYDTINPYNSDTNVGFIPNSNTYVSIEFKTIDAALFFGYGNLREQSITPMVANGNLKANIKAIRPISLIYGYPESIILKVNLPLDSYDNGKLSNILSFIPNAYSSALMLNYNPSPPIYINLKNRDDYYLDSLTVRLEDKDGKLLADQANVSIILLIESPKL